MDFASDNLGLFFYDHGDGLMPAGESCGEKRVGVHNGVDIRTRQIDLPMDFELGRRLTWAFDDLALVRNRYHVFRGQGTISDSARGDNQPSLDSGAHIAVRGKDVTYFLEPQARANNLFFQVKVQNAHFS